MASNVFINEFHYDNSGTDAGEFVEIAAPAGTDLTGWKIVLYNGTSSGTTALKVYGTAQTLSGVVADQQNGFGTISVSYPSNGIQNGGSGANGEPDGIALVDAQGNVVQFLSYEGIFTAADGPAAGMTSVNVGSGVFEDGAQGGTSIGLVGSGTALDDFHYALINGATAGGINTGQAFAGVVTPSAGTLNIADAATVEGNAGTHDIVFSVARADGSAGAVSATWTVTLPGGASGADAGDLAGGLTLTGTVSFADGATTAEIRLPVQGDVAFEANETFSVSLSNAQGGVTLSDAVAVGTITNDDAVPPSPAGERLHQRNPLRQFRHRCRRGDRDRRHGGDRPHRLQACLLQRLQHPRRGADL